MSLTIVWNTDKVLRF